MTQQKKRRAVSIETPYSQTRREILASLAMTGGAAAIGASAWGAAGDKQKPAVSEADLSARARDWDWLLGDWDVWHRRLKDRLAGSTQWEEFAGQSVFWRTMGGLGNIDDNSLDLPGGVYRGLTLRAFNPEKGQWAIWWLDGRKPGRIDPPVMGGFEGDTGTFIGQDIYKGRPVTVKFRWLEVHGSKPHWEQSFSPDRGKTWEVNWRNYFTRRSPTPTSLPLTEGAGIRERHDWDFLVGRWNVRNRRLKQRLAGSTQWEEFTSTLVNWPVLGGMGNVGDNVFESPTGSYRGVSARAFDPDKRQWLSWWLDARNPGVINEPMRGSFANGVGTLIGDDQHNGRPIKVRSQWSKTTPDSAHWEQAASADGGATWETNWVGDLTRAV